MGEVNAAYATVETKSNVSQKSDSSQGTLKSEFKERQVFPFSDTESVTQATSDFLQQANQQPDLSSLAGHEIVYFPAEEITLHHEISDLLTELSPEGKEMQEPQKSSNSPLPLSNLHSKEKHSKTPEHGAKQAPQNADSANQYSIPKSIFQLAARSYHQTLNFFKSDRGNQNSEKNTHLALSQEATIKKEASSSQESQFWDRNSDDSKQGKDQEGRREQEDSQDEKYGIIQEDPKIKKVSNLQNNAHRSVNKTHRTKRRTPVRTTLHRSRTPLASSPKRGKQSIYGIDNIFIRFMALMARILGQAEAEAHDLYIRIKERTDQIDTLTQLLSKINSEKGAIDWSNDEEMKQLISKAREIGVDIAEDKLKWSEEEKKMLKENIQMRKDSMEKVTQLERTDMQRYLQEASQCHQARSNVLKLLKEVNDTIIHNMRP